MAEEAKGPIGASADVGQRRSEGPPLGTARGSTTIADVVVTKIAALAAREVRGITELGGTTARAVGAVGERVGVGVADELARGVSVEVGEQEAAVDLTVVIEYGESIPRVAQAVRDNVIRRIEGLTGLRVIEVNIAVDDLGFPGGAPRSEPPTRVS